MTVVDFDERVRCTYDGMDYSMVICSSHSNTTVRKMRKKVDVEQQSSTWSRNPGYDGLSRANGTLSRYRRQCLV